MCFYFIDSKNNITIESQLSEHVGIQGIQIIEMFE